MRLQFFSLGLLIATCTSLYLHLREDAAWSAERSQLAAPTPICGSRAQPQSLGIATESREGIADQETARCGGPRNNRNREGSLVHAMIPATARDVCRHVLDEVAKGAGPCFRL